MDLTVRYANFDELPRVNELRRTVRFRWFEKGFMRTK